MKFLTQKNFTFSDFQALLFNSDPLSLDLSVHSQFLLPSASVSLLSSEEIQGKLGQLANFDLFLELDASFERSFLFFIILSVFKSRKTCRKEIIDQLILLFNKPTTQLTELRRSPVSTILLISSLSTQELAVLQEAIPFSYCIALIVFGLKKYNDLFYANQASFAFFLEQNNFSTGFLGVLSEKKALSRFVSEISENVLLLLQGSKMNKIAANTSTLSFVELLASSKLLFKNLGDLIAEEFLLEQPEEALKGKNLDTLGLLSQNLANNIEAIIANILKRGGHPLPSFTIPEIKSPFTLIPEAWNLVKKTLIWSELIRNENEQAFNVLEKIASLPEPEKKKKAPMGKGTSALLKLLIDNKAVSPFTDLNVFLSLVLPCITSLLQSRNEERRLPKIPKGTRDFTPVQTSIRKKAFQIITDVFLKHGAVEIDTPVFELKETLTGKYGEDSKLIYDLQDQGGELLSLRYDLTVPFARYLAIKSISSIKRYHIAKVYRRDNPVMSKGRFREFYQCDFDIAGNYDVMLPDAEVIKVIDEILDNLKIGPFIIKVNNRKLLDAMVELSGAPKQKFKQICSAIDKLDKESWADVRKELVEEKGIAEEAADKLGYFVSLKGEPKSLLVRLKAEKTFESSAIGAKAIEEMEILFNYLEAMNGLNNVSFELSLARGLDYYTGVIFEAILQGAEVGSISGGGRYDELVGMFSNKPIPAVGASIGIERIFTILEQQLKNDTSIRQNQTEIVVATIGGGMVFHKLKLLNELWENGIKAETIYNEKPKPQKQLGYALENYVPFIVWMGENELKENKCNLKCLYTGKEEMVGRDDLIKILKEKLKEYYQDLENKKIVFNKPEDQAEEKKEDKRKKK